MEVALGMLSTRPVDSRRKWALITRSATSYRMCDGGCLFRIMLRSLLPQFDAVAMSLKTMRVVVVENPYIHVDRMLGVGLI